jgi:hypothetical protein
VCCYFSMQGIHLREESCWKSLRVVLIIVKFVLVIRSKSFVNLNWLQKALGSLFQKYANVRVLTLFSSEFERSIKRFRRAVLVDCSS